MVILRIYRVYLLPLLFGLMTMLAQNAVVIIRARLRIEDRAICWNASLLHVENNLFSEALVTDDKHCLSAALLVESVCQKTHIRFT